MENKITIKEDTIENVVDISSRIVEFDDKFKKNYFEERYLEKEKLILVAYFENKPAGYLVSYDNYNDGSFYCWMAAVDPEFRRKGILSELMTRLEDWARENGYKKIRIKTRNNKREMLSYLVKNGFYFINIEECPLIEDHRLLLEKNIYGK